MSGRSAAFPGPQPGAASLPTGPASASSDRRQQPQVPGQNNNNNGNNNLNLTTLPHDQQPAAPQPPAVAQPTGGGGALRGMGEKFQANVATGTSSFAIPIDTSTSRGCTPALSLSYSSGSGNGAFGLGWGLSIGSIVRRTDKGLPQYQDAIDSDVFLLESWEDLVPFPGEPGEAADPVGVTYLVRRYRPRTESRFSRIERWTQRGDPDDVFWRITTAQNITSIFGRDDESRIF